jgi:flagella basal body P-ring formation protein FlgA
MVEQKKPVTIAFSNQGIYVEVDGVSLENGQFGEIIKVENLSSGKTVFGKVIANRKISPIH